MLATGPLTNSAPALRVKSRGASAPAGGKPRRRGRSRGKKARGKVPQSGYGSVAPAGASRVAPRKVDLSPMALTMDDVDVDEDPYAMVRELEQRMLLLKWRKAETDARIKTMINETRQMQEQDMMVALSLDKTSEKSAWMQTVIQDELKRPLTVDDDYLQRLEHDEKLQALRAKEEAARHEKVLRHVKRDIAARAAEEPPSPTQFAFGVRVGADSGSSLFGDESLFGGPPERDPATLLPALRDSESLSRDALKRLKAVEDIEAEVKKAKAQHKAAAKAVPLSKTLKKKKPR